MFYDFQKVQCSAWDVGIDIDTKVQCSAWDVGIDIDTKDSNH